MPRRLTDPSPLSRRIAARRRHLGQSQAAAAAALSTTDRPRQRQSVAAWERGALPRSVELPMLADWMGQPLALVRQWWRAQRRARAETFESLNIP